MKCPIMSRLVFALGLSAVSLSTAVGEDSIEYNRDIRPILAEACFACHGPDSVAREADLRLDQRESALDMAAIVPGEVDESELVRRIRSDDAYTPGGEAGNPPPRADSVSRARAPGGRDVAAPRVRISSRLGDIRP